MSDSSADCRLAVEPEGWLRPRWDTPDAGRKARFYAITAAGRRQLEEEERRWITLTDAVNRALRFA